MTKQKAGQDASAKLAISAAELRLHAEEVQRERIKQTPEIMERLSLEEVRRVLHELQVHQIELEMQNGELRRTQDELCASRLRYFELYDLAPVGYLVISSKGLILEANLTFATLLGVNRGTLAGQPLSHFIQFDDQDIYYHFRKLLFEKGEPQDCEVRLLKKDGTDFWALLDATLTKDADGVEVCHVVVSDITESRKIREAQLFLLQCGYLKKGEDFFESLAEYLAQSLGIYYVCIDRLLGDGLQAQTVAVYCGGEFQDNFEYALKGTPCGVLVGRNVCCYPRDVGALFPYDAALKELSAQSYIGVTLWSFDGKPIGHIALLDRMPLKKPGVAEALLRLVSVRAAGELERRQVEEALAESESRYRAVIEQAPESILLCDPDTGTVVEANSRFTELFGYDLRQEEPLTLFELIVDEPEKIRVFFEKLKQIGSLLIQHRICKHRNGTCVTVELSATLVSYRGRNLFVMTLRDVSDEVRREQEEHFQATHDELTGLYNRLGFAEGVAKTIATGTGGALLLVDIDDFKLINDAYGHVVGDKYLTAFGAYLRENFGETDLVARFGGDEFILFFAGPDGLSCATRSSDRMAVICLETEIGSFFVQLSGGIAVLSEQETDLNLQIQRAYLALQHAKDSGKWSCKTYESVLQDKFNRRYAVREALNHAIANGEFRLVFQPIFDIRESAGIVGYEALLRWTNPGLGELSPAEFIPVAEETNLILPIGKWVLHEACRFSANIGELYGECVSVAVNISMRQLAMPNFVAMVKETLQETGLPACNLTLEVTESILMTDAATRISYLQELHNFGVAISLDDFGTGYSSFTYLAQMPITTLKIDKSMMDEIPGGSSKSLLLMESLLQLSAFLGYRVIAEGVETQEQLDFLKSKGCSYCQGYLLSRPMTEMSVLAMVGKRQQTREGTL